MKQTRRKFIRTSSITFAVGLTGTGFCFGCTKDTDAIPDNEMSITGISVPSTLYVEKEGEVTISGKGFDKNDLIKLTLSSDSEVFFMCNVLEVSENDVTFKLSEDITTETYKVAVVRGDDSLTLGSVLLNVTANLDIPDVEGMTVKGVVYSDGEGIPGVVVSDGSEVVLTDKEGRYYLPSLKENGFVFISVPGNFEVPLEGNIPQFFKTISSNTDEVEQKDFSLLRANNENHVVLTMADWHLANRNNDLEQFVNNILPDVNSTIDEYSNSGAKVYALTLGDLTWELYWDKNNFYLDDFLPYMNKLNCPVFNVMGNHDNNPYYNNDKEAENSYRNVLGPTYYSFNLGKIHYVVLDSVEYLNTGGAEGVIGKRNYNEKVTSEQLEWLRKDLSAITNKNTPIVLAMHTPLYKTPTLDTDGNQVDGLDLQNGTTLIEILEDFSEVHILSGHTHINYSVEEKSSIMEHNTAAISATWWWTGKNGYANNHICKDGSPGGYGVWEIKGTDVRWYYKSAGYEKDYQFRTYDLNEIKITAANFSPNSTDEELSVYAGNYAQVSAANDVLINIWGYDNQWKIEVVENGNKLKVKRVEELDPLHIVSYEAQRLNAGATPTQSFVTSKTAHLFKVTAFEPDSALEIAVTDRFGNVYSETMERPKAFDLNMS